MAQVPVDKARSAWMHTIASQGWTNEPNFQAVE